MLSFLRRHPALVFIALVYPLSWYQWLLGYADKHPGDSGINPLGPLAAGVIASLLNGGLRGLGGYLKRAVKVWAPPRAWAAAILTPIGLCAAAVAITVARGAPAPDIAGYSGWSGLLESIVLIVLFIGLGEEPGWRGFLLHQLQSKTLPLVAALIVGAVWAVWHLPLLRTEITPEIAAPFFLSVVTASIVLAWIFNLGRGAVPPLMIAHGLVNSVGAGFLFTFFEGDAKIALWWTYSLVWSGFAVGLALLTRGRLAAEQA